MDAIENLKTRASIRAFTRQSVPKEIVDDLVDCARLAPTALNIQPWEFVAFTDAELRGKIARLTNYGGFIADAPVCVAVLSKDTKYYIEDGSAATENLLLAAHARGLGACWVAGDKKPYADEIRRMLGAPDGYKLVSLIPIGYPVEHKRAQKRPLKEVLHWERF